MEKVAVDLPALSETLLIPLWARAEESARERPLVRDDKAVELCASLDFDF